MERLFQGMSKKKQHSASKARRVLRQCLSYET